MQLRMRDIQEGICCRLTSSLFQALLLTPSNQLSFGGAVTIIAQQQHSRSPDCHAKNPKATIQRQKGSKFEGASTSVLNLEIKR
jgi:hypothetical protein